MPNPKVIAEENNKVLISLFKEKIKGYFLINIKDQVIQKLGIQNFIKYYDTRWSDERAVTGIGVAAEYDICRMIVGIHRAHSIFLSKDEIRKNEKNEKYKQQIISETIEKIKLRSYGSIHFRKNPLLKGEEFIYYPLAYELFAICIKMGEMLGNVEINCLSLYFGIMNNCISALTLMEDNLLGSAYPLCRGAIEIYLKLLAISKQPQVYRNYEYFRIFEIKQSCCEQTYPEEFNKLFEKRICCSSKSKKDYLHYGWVDYINDYHNIVKGRPYSVYGLLEFIKYMYGNKMEELERIESFYKSCHAYTHGSVQMAIYPVLHYFEISIMLYDIIRDTFQLLCKEKNEEPIINGMDIISMIDKDFKELYKQYAKRSTENFERYYKK